MYKTQSILDTRSLQLFVTVMESQSLTEAADKLGINQSTVSHTLSKLRVIFDDPLLIRSGRTVIATERANELLPKVKKLLSEFELLIENPLFDPKATEFDYIIAANDFQAQTLLPLLYQHLSPLVGSLKLTIVPSWLPDIGLLRDEQTDLVISPNVPESGDIVQRKLYEFNQVCYYNPHCRSAPKTQADFIEANYICPSFFLNFRDVNLSQSSDKPVWLHERTQIITACFSSGADFLSQSTSLAIAPALLKDKAFKPYAYVPFSAIQPATMYLIWNRKFQKDPKHLWFRQQLVNLVQATEKPPLTVTLSKR